MMDELQRLRGPWPTSGRGSAPSASLSERVLTLELTQDHHSQDIGRLSTEMTRLRDAQRDEAQAKATAEKVQAEIREARRNMISVVALMISAGMLAIALTRFVGDSRPPGSPVSATTVPAPR